MRQYVIHLLVNLAEMSVKPAKSLAKIRQNATAQFLNIVSTCS